MLFAWAHLPKLARAEGRDPRLLVIVLRGALDGLAAVAPVGDPDWVKLRGDNALALDGKTPALPLDAFFALNPAMPNLHRLYQAGQATIVHAAATPYRERSHFDGQDVLESGVGKPGAADTGWLNRALNALEPEGRVNAGSRKALRGRPGDAAGGARTGAGDVMGAAAPAAGERRHHACGCSISTATPIRSWRARSKSRIRLAAMARDGSMDAMKRARRWPAGGARHRARPRLFRRRRRHRGEISGAAGRPARRRARLQRLGHPHQRGHRQRAARQSVRRARRRLRMPSRPAWATPGRDTVVAVVTEFGRTARINGTEGTDHGTGTVALLIGGALKGGRVVADWPGLKASDLYENRDLKPTTDLRAVLKGLLRDHLRVDDRALAEAVFPGSEAVKPMSGLV